MKDLPSTPWPHGYAYLLMARANSTVILWIDFTLIFSALSYVWHASAATIGIASALYGLPGLLLGPFFGRLADKHPPLSFLRFSYLARGVASLCLLFAPNVESFVFFVGVKGLSNLGAMPAEQVLIRSMLPSSRFVDNARWMTLIDQGIKIVAPLLGAVIASGTMSLAGFGFSAMLAVLGGALLLVLARVYIPVGESAVIGSAPSMVELWRFVQAHKAFRYALIASLVQTMTLGLYDPMLALFLRTQGFAASTFGEIISCTAAGGIVGALLFKQVFSLQSTTVVVTMSLVGFGSTVLAPGLLVIAGTPLDKFVLFALWIVNGACFGIAAMTFGVLMQTASPVHALGTISATVRSAQLAALVIGPLIGSNAIRWISLPTLFVAAGVLAIATGLFLAGATACKRGA